MLLFIGNKVFTLIFSFILITGRRIYENVLEDFEFNHPYTKYAHKLIANLVGMFPLPSKSLGLTVAARLGVSRVVDLGGSHVKEGEFPGLVFQYLPF